MTLTLIIGVCAYFVVGLGHCAWYHERVWTTADRAVYDDEELLYCVLQLLVASGWPLLDVWDGVRWLRRRHDEVLAWRRLEHSMHEALEARLRQQVGALDEVGETPPEREA